MRYKFGFLAAVVVSLVACKSDAPAVSADSAANVDSTTINATKQTAADTIVELPDVITWDLSARGIGPLSTGMSVPAARKALGGTFAGADTTLGCHLASVPGAPGKVTAMLVDGRLDVVYTTDAAIVTDLGVRVGDTQAKVESLYVGRVSAQPHKYLPQGNYLVISPLNPMTPADSARRIIFETDGKKVIESRTGVLPSVAFTEHCS